MKIDWFTPLPPARTDVGHFSARILPVLSGYCDVTVWAPQKRWERSLEAYANIRPIQEGKMPWLHLNRNDAVIYNIGNDARFHTSIYKISQLHSGIVILHDLDLHEFFGETPPDVQVNELDIPHIRRVLNNADGAITHNGGRFDQVAASTSAPALFTPLPYCTKENLRHVLSNKKKRRSGYPIPLVCFGFFGGQNRRMRQILEALSSFPGKEKFRLDVFGEVAFAKALKSWIAELGLRRLVKVHGFVSESKLNTALDEAALCLNLRYPTRGEASGSLLRAWNHSLPCMVTCIDWYKSLPEDCVAFVRPEFEIYDIQKHLNALLEQPELLKSKGKAGRKYLEQYHMVEDYVKNFLEFLPEVSRFRGKAFAQNFSRRASRMLAREFDKPDVQKYLTERTAREIASWL